MMHGTTSLKVAPTCFGVATIIRGPTVWAC